MRFATALSVIVVLGIASSASAVYTETFDTFYSDGDEIDLTGNPGGWAQAAFHGSVVPSTSPTNIVLSAADSPRGHIQSLVATGNPDPGEGGARLITGDIVGTSYTVQMDILHGGGSQTRWYIGDSASTFAPATTNENLYVEWNINNNLTIANLQAGGSLVTIVPTTLDANILGGWTQMRAEVTDIGTGNTSLSVDVRQLGSSTWLNAGSISGFTGTIDSIVVNAQAGTQFDNIVSGVVPEPASLGLLALGGLMMLLRRRRRA